MYIAETPSLRGGVTTTHPDRPHEWQFNAALTECQGWNIQAHIDTSGATPIITSLEVFRQVEGRNPYLPGIEPTPELLTTAVLRAVKLTEVINAANVPLSLFSGQTLPHPGRQRPGSDRFYAAWAAQYVALSGSRRPVADLAEKTGKSREQVRDLIHQCRAKGMLTKGRPGHAGGELTELALRVLGVEDGAQ